LHGLFDARLVPGQLRGRSAFGGRIGLLLAFAPGAHAAFAVLRVVAGQPGRSGAASARAVSAGHAMLLATLRVCHAESAHGSVGAFTSTETGRISAGALHAVGVVRAGALQHACGALPVFIAGVEGAQVTDAVSVDDAKRHDGAGSAAAVASATDRAAARLALLVEFACGLIRTVATPTVGVSRAGESTGAGHAMRRFAAAIAEGASAAGPAGTGGVLRAAAIFTIRVVCPIACGADFAVRASTSSAATSVPAVPAQAVRGLAARLAELAFRANVTSEYVHCNAFATRAVRVRAAGVANGASAADPTRVRRYAAESIALVRARTAAVCCTARAGSF